METAGRRELRLGQGGTWSLPPWRERSLIYLTDNTRGGLVGTRREIKGSLLRGQIKGHFCSESRQGQKMGDGTGEAPTTAEVQGRATCFGWRCGYVKGIS